MNIVEFVKLLISEISNFRIHNYIMYGEDDNVKDVKVIVSKEEIKKYLVKKSLRKHVYEKIKDEIEHSSFCSVLIENKNVIITVKPFLVNGKTITLTELNLLTNLKKNMGEIKYGKRNK